ncbi:tryptophan halogenase [Brevundimonas intermedia]|uniref:Tryptophan halogenase n=1 Tax=Brevundimonas intermedia TaxID=74315 RepID=A0ABQ5TB09_9CAUL|nr:tryptophan 7-halogenase [Brevundimonas intermedia]GLK50004.1 tryptophan halogenase [Brevundimonas intermedia]
MKGAPISHVVIVGSGVDAWLTALALARAVGPLGVAIKVLQTPTNPTPVVLDALPALRALHRLLGVDEQALVTQCGAVPVVGQRFTGWNLDQPPFVRAYASVGDGGSHLEFIQHWLRARTLGMTASFGDFSPAGVAAAKRRGPPIQGEWNGADYGYHLDGAAYVELLQRKALAAGVTLRAVQSLTVHRREGGVEHLDIADSCVSADLYIDATGEDARLALAGSWEDWSACFPFPKLGYFTASRTDQLEALTENVAFPSGWAAVLDLAATRVIAAVLEDQISGDTAKMELEAVLGGSLSHSGAYTAARPGMRDGWVGNCVSLGRSAIRTDVLEGGWLLGLQIGLSHLIANFPLCQDMAGEARLFNSAVRRHAEAVRDYQTANYRLSNRSEPKWRQAARAPVPSSLQARLDLFALRGALPPFEDEVFQADDWRMMLLGHGLIPTDANPAGKSLDDAVERQRLLGIIQRNVEEAAGLPSVEAWRSSRGAA